MKRLGRVRARLIVAPAVLIALVGGCADPSEDASGPAKGSVPGRTSSVTWTVDTSSCPSGYRPLTISTEIAVEVAYLQDVIACTNPEESLTYLRNVGNAVWRPRSVLSAGVTYYSDNPETASFREAISGAYTYALLTPNQSLVVGAPPLEVQWDLDLGLSVSWNAHELLVDELKSVSVETAVAAIGRRSPTGRALASCTYGVWEAFDNADDVRGTKPSDWVAYGLSGTSGGATCLRAVQTAEAEEISLGRTPRLTTGRLPKISSSHVKLLNEADTYLTKLLVFGKTLLIGLR